MRQLIFLLAFLFLTTAVKAQDNKENIQSPFIFVLNHINYDKIKDSTAFYTFSLKIDIEKKSNRQQINININNPEIMAAFDNLDTLQKINYDAYLKNGKAKILIRYYIIILSSDYKPKLIDVHEMPRTIQYFFEERNNEYIDFGPYGIMVDKKVYD